MQIKLEALDTLFFRDGKPFEMGDESWANGVFPPPPSVIYGALRTWYILHHPTQIQQLANYTDEEDTKQKDKSLGISIQDFCFEYKGKILFSLPKDLIKDKQETPHLLSLQASAQGSSSHALTYRLSTQKEVDNFGAYTFLEQSQFEKYLNGNVPTEVCEAKFFTEPKVGIGRDKQTHTTANSKLYRVGMARLSDAKNQSLSFVLRLNDEAGISENACFKMGGEGKLVSATVMNSEKSKTLETPTLLTSKYFKMVLMTPAIFKGGWLPSFISNQAPCEGEWEGLKIRLIAAAIDKPLSIGGFDMQSRSPKTMRKAVPAGSVYFFEILGEYSKDAPSKVSQPFRISDFKSNEGFGLAYWANLGSLQI